MALFGPYADNAYLGGPAHEWGKDMHEIATQINYLEYWRGVSPVTTFECQYSGGSDKAYASLQAQGDYDTSIYTGGRPSMLDCINWLRANVLGLGEYSFGFTLPTKESLLTIRSQCQAAIGKCVTWMNAQEHYTYDEFLEYPYGVACQTWKYDEQYERSQSSFSPGSVHRAGPYAPIYYPNQDWYYESVSMQFVFPATEYMRSCSMIFLLTGNDGVQYSGKSYGWHCYYAYRLSVDGSLRQWIDPPGEFEYLLSAPRNVNQFGGSPIISESGISKTLFSCPELVDLAQGQWCNVFLVMQEEPDWSGFPPMKEPSDFGGWASEPFPETPKCETGMIWGLP